jgi:hypothetical protein
VCKRYGILPSEFLEIDPIWVDFNLAVALKGQLEEAKAHEEEMKKMEQENKKLPSSSLPPLNKQHSKYLPQHREPLKERVKKMTRPEDILALRKKMREQGHTDIPLAIHS